MSRSINEIVGLKSVTVKTPDGPKIYSFNLLKSRRGRAVFHKSASIILTALGGAIEKAVSSDKLEGGAAGAIIAMANVDIDVVEDLAKALLSGCQIKIDPNNLQRIVVIDDIDTTDYFDDKHEEFYVAIYHALRANYPKSFSRIESGFGPLLDVAKEKFSTLSMAGSQTDTPSQNTTG